VTEPVYFNSWPEGQEKAVVKAMFEALILRHEARRQKLKGISHFPKKLLNLDLVFLSKYLLFRITHS
jgi:hypothetical protein